MTYSIDELYVKKARIYRPVLEAGFSSARWEAEGLARIFKRYGVGAKAGNRPKVLDVSCGIGRHSIRLAKMGYEVVGFDFSPHFLRKARTLRRQAGLSGDVLRFYEGDTANIEKTLRSRGENGFDAIICMDTSLVRSALKKEIELLRSMYGLAKEKAILVIETANRESFLKYRSLHSFPFVQSFSNGKLQRHVRAGYDERTRHIKGEWQFFRKLRNGDLKYLASVEFDSVIHSQKDLRKILEVAGWVHVQDFGSVAKLNKLSSDSYHIVMVGKKPPSTDF